MKKFKLGFSFTFVIIYCLMFNRFILLINYLLALFLHELAHLFVATRRGYSLQQIRLDIFGLSMQLDEKIDDKDKFAINIAGPLLNIFMCIICMAMYWLVPSSYFYLNTFCLANMILALFNLLPIYPLDGGKIMQGLIKKERIYSIVDSIIRIIFSIVLIVLFVVFSYVDYSWLLLIISLFLLTTKQIKTPTLSIFKYSKHNKIEKVSLYKLTGEENLYELIKKIRYDKYIIFYYKTKRNLYIDEDSIVEMATKLPMNTKIKEIYL